MNERLAQRILKDIKIDGKKQELYEKLLALEDDKERIASVELEYGTSLGLGVTSDSYSGRLFWTSRTPFNMNVEVTMKKDHGLEELKEYLQKHGLPGDRTYQFSRASYGIDFEEHNFGVHFGLER